MTTTDSLPPEEVLDRLNAYVGDNLWQDVIYGLLDGDEWGAAADRSDRFTRQDVEYRWEPSEQEWTTRT